MDPDKGIVAGCICPHPPLLIPEIGGRDIATVRATERAMRELSSIVAGIAPDVLVVISPHTPIMTSSFTVSSEKTLRGDFGQFGVRQVGLERPNDLEMVESLLKSSVRAGVPLEVRTRYGDILDHGVLVPLHFICQATEAPIVSLSISMLSYRQHAELGELVRKCSEDLGRRTLFVASGDLSHRLIPRAPAGYSPRGKDFDEAIAHIAEKGDFASLSSIDEGLVDEAGECGFRSIHTLWGCLRAYEFESRLLSYEGPFGVGYLVSLHRTSGTAAGEKG